MEHEFLLIDRRQHGGGETGRFTNCPDRVILPDDLLQYLADTLVWIPTFNPSRQEPHKGLCMEGMTQIRDQGSKAAEQVFRAWASLFTAGPETIVLTGDYTWHQSDCSSEREHVVGEYESHEFDRSEVIAKLSQLADWAAQVGAGNNRWYIHHNGL